MKNWYCIVMLFILSSCDASKLNITRKDVEIEKALRLLNKTPIKSIESPDGDIIDCIDIYQQPAFDNPLMKNHTILSSPSYDPLKNLPVGSRIYNLTAHARKNPKPIPQLWHLNGKCPEGTIPIVRTTKEDLLRAGNISRYGMKVPNSIPGNDNPSDHEYGIASVKGQKFYGAWGTFNVWQPHVQEDNELSLTQIWAVAGGKDKLNTIEVGWLVYPVLNGDRRTRLFIYWTRDGYGSTGCYNLKCRGFVQTNNDVAIGGELNPVSTIRGDQKEITIMIYKDERKKAWWLEVDNNVLGYWPKKIFTHLSLYAERIDWGGEVVNRNVGRMHTTTEMGSGQFPDRGVGQSSYVKNLLVIDESMNLVSFNGQMSVITTKSRCYDTKLARGHEDWGDHIFYGGPGRDHGNQCQ